MNFSCSLMVAEKQLLKLVQRIRFLLYDSVLGLVESSENSDKRFLSLMNYGRSTIDPICRIRISPT